MLVAVVATTGCAARGRAAAAAPAPATAAGPEGTADGSLHEDIAKVRHVSSAARPANPTAATTLEGRDPELAAALLHVQASPSAEWHLVAGGLYRQHSVLDAAYRHYNAAAKLQPRNAEAYDGLARIWRDWGMPELAVGDAVRARFYAPESPVVHNTFGTIMQALGRTADARRAYERARQLDERATYALNNLCYLSFLEGRVEAAVEQCRAAVALDPALKTARHNLALAYAASGEVALAQAAFAEGGDAGGGQLQPRHRAHGWPQLPGGDGGVRRRQPRPADAQPRARTCQPGTSADAHRATRSQPARRWRREVTTTMLASQEVVPHPTAPDTLEASGLSLDLVLQLVLKTLHFAGELSGSDLSRRLGLSFSVLVPAPSTCSRRSSRSRSSAAASSAARPIATALPTAAGRERRCFSRTATTWAMRRSRSRQYQEYMRAFRAAAPRNATQDRIRGAFAHLVISDKVLDQLGPAINAGHSMFVYGPPGNGKTVISQAIRSLLDGEIAIPHALEVEGNIIRLFDPVNHEEIADGLRDDSSLTTLGTARSPLGALQAADGHGRRRADARVARAEL